MSEAVRAYLPPAFQRERAWGFGINLYAVRSKRNWGIGDLTDLSDAVRIFRQLGAGIVGINPLHALHYLEPEAASPYSPSSRYFLNPLYLDVEAVDELAARSAPARALRGMLSSRSTARSLETLRALPMVDYAGVARAKWQALEALYSVFLTRGGARARAFEAFVDDGGERLERFATYEALNEHFRHVDGRHGWMTWPQEYHEPGSEEVAAFARRRRERVRYYQYLQWLVDQQLTSASEAFEGTGIGLYRDLAVGVDANGADVWSNRETFVLEESVGAPPDPLGPLGQNWGLPPPDPARLLEGEGATFRRLLATNMAHAGALRIDHVMALARLYRIPHGKPPVEGAYVDYPLEPLLAILADQSRRARCLVVGEDLGTVPETFREHMQAASILSHRLLLFERCPDGRFLPPEAYPVLALATATTHDLPTLAGWAIARDLDVRERIGLLPPHEAAQARALRRLDVSHLLDALLARATLDRAAFDVLHAAIDAKASDGAVYRALIAAVYRFLAQTPSRIVLIALDDVLTEFDQVNLPGTYAEYPNWRRKNGMGLEAIASDGGIAAIAREVDERLRRGTT